MYIMRSKVTAVTYFSAHKSSQNLVCCCLFAFTCRQTSLLLLVSLRSNAIPRYSIYAHPCGQPTQGSRPRDHWIWCEIRYIVL